MNDCYLQFECPTLQNNNAGLAGENSSEAGFTFTRSLPGVQRGGLSNCEYINLFLWSELLFSYKYCIYVVKLENLYMKLCSYKVDMFSCLHAILVP